MCDDFRAIVISLILSNVFDHCFLSRFQCMLETTDNPFGLKKESAVVIVGWTNKNRTFLRYHIFAATTDIIMRFLPAR